MIIFLSYAKEDVERVDQIYNQLKHDGHQPWMDIHDISPGQNWKFEIHNAISTCNAAIIFLSNRSVSKTGYVQAEIAEFLDLRKRRPERSIYLIPVRIDECVVPTRMSELQYADLFKPNGWDRVTASLEKAKHEQSLLSEQGESRGKFTVFTRIIEEYWDGLPGYYTRLSYPEVRGGATIDACEEINQIFKARCLSKLHELRANRLDQNPFLWENKREYGIANYKMIKDYRITLISEMLLSIVDSYEVYTGGVHENYYFETSNLTLQPVSRLPLFALFKAGCDYREKLGLLCREALKRQAWERSAASTESSEFFAHIFDEEDAVAREWLIEGTSFKDGSNITFTIAENGLTFYFRPYEVACFAAGGWEVSLPYYDLREILRPEALRLLPIPKSPARP